MVTFCLKKGMRKVGKSGSQSALKEMKQLHDRKCFEPIKKEALLITDEKRALESMMFLTGKKDGIIYAQHCANGNHRENR